MSPEKQRIARRLLALVIVAIGAAGVFKARAMGDLHGYRWEPDPEAPRCEVLTWVQVARNRIPGLCSDLHGRAAREGSSCALACVVVSPYSEAQAHHIDLWGESLYDHEARHVFGRMRHPQ